MADRILTHPWELRELANLKRILPPPASVLIPLLHRIGCYVGGHDEQNRVSLIRKNSGQVMPVSERE